MSEIKVVISYREDLNFTNTYDCEYVNIQNIVTENNMQLLSRSKCIENRTLQEPFSVLYTSGLIFKNIYTHLMQNIRKVSYK